LLLSGFGDLESEVNELRSRNLELEESIGRLCESPFIDNAFKSEREHMDLRKFKKGNEIECSGNACLCLLLHHHDPPLTKVPPPIAPTHSPHTNTHTPPTPKIPNTNIYKSITCKNKSKTTTKL
jgi:hypothetical protein